jgi:hypothetical protein
MAPLPKEPKSLANFRNIYQMHAIDPTAPETHKRDQPFVGMGPHAGVGDKSISPVHCSGQGA